MFELGDKVTIKDFEYIGNPASRMGWECPVCGRGNAIWLATCPCYQPKSAISTIADTWQWDVKQGSLTATIEDGKFIITDMNDDG